MGYQEQLKIEAEANLSALQENPYPGRGLVIGVNSIGDTAIQAYWVMGRSENSRNRLLVVEDDIVRTAAFDESKVKDPSLIIYNAMRITGDLHIVSNGDQTDTIVEFVEDGKSIDDALLTRSYEPDAPNFTPRITGYTKLRPEHPGFGIYVIRKSPEGDFPITRRWAGEILPATSSDKGIGNCVHTYKGDGDPLPSFDGDPYPLPLGESAQETAELYWEHLDKENRVSIVAKGINLLSGAVDYHIINAHQQ